MGKSLGEVRALPAAELAEWTAFDRVEGLPDHVDRAILAVMGGRSRPARPATAVRLSPEASAGLMSGIIGRAR